MAETKESTILVDIDYFIDEFKSTYELDKKDPNDMLTFEKFTQIAQDQCLAIAEPFMENRVGPFIDNLTKEQLRLLKQSICIWIEHWLMNGYDLTPTGTKSYQAIGFNFSKTNPMDPEFIPRQVLWNLGRAKLFRSIVAIPFSQAILRADTLYDSTKVEELKKEREDKENTNE